MNSLIKIEQLKAREEYIEKSNSDARIDCFTLNNKKRLKYILCFRKHAQKKIIINMMIAIDNKIIVDNITDVFLFKSELELFHIDENSSYFELKSQKIDKKISYSLKLKNEKIYFTKAEAKSINSLIKNLIIGCSFRELIIHEKEQSFEAWKKLLEKKGFGK